MIVPLQHVDDYRAMEGALLRTCFEIAARLTTQEYDTVPIVRVSGGQLREEDVLPVLDAVRVDAVELRRAMLAD